jgi:hypothetical protein
MSGHRLEVLVAGQAIIWGTWIGNPWWAAFPSSTAYNWMTTLMPEWIWGYSMVMIGIGQLLSLCLGSTRFRLAVNLLALFAWILITTAFALGNWRSTATCSSVFFAVAQALLYIDSITTWQRRRNGNPHVK